MSVEENIKSMIDRKFGNVKFFAEKINLPYTTVRSILQRGILNAKLDNVIRIADGLGMKPEELLTMEDTASIPSIETIYNKLNEDRKKIVYECANEQLKEQSNRSDVPSLQTYREEKERERKEAAESYGAVSAGTGEFLFGVERAETVYLPESNFPDEPFDYVLKINGDSMLPTYKNGEYIFVKSFSNGGHVRSGMLAIVLYENEVYFKKVYFNDDHITLVPLNKEYSDIEVTELDHFKVLGKVVS